MVQLLPRILSRGHLITSCTARGLATHTDILNEDFAKEESLMISALFLLERYSSSLAIL